MPRKPRQPSAGRQVAPLSPAGPQPLELSASARQLVADIEHDWTLSPPTRALLRAAAEALTQCERFDELAAADGYVVRDKKGATKPSPASLLARDHRAAFTSTMQRLLAHLEK